MINTNNGNLIIDGNYTLNSNLKFIDFTKSSYFNNQNDNRLINLKGLHQVEDRFFYISLFFKDSILKKIYLMVDDDCITNPLDEPKRKSIHDSILIKKGISESEDFSWGRVISDYDFKSNMSSIIVSYNNSDFPPV